VPPYTLREQALNGSRGSPRMTCATALSVNEGTAKVALGGMDCSLELVDRVSVQHTDEQMAD